MKLKDETVLLQWQWVDLKFLVVIKWKEILWTNSVMRVVNQIKVLKF
jgi:hypothetical protein